MEEAILSMLYKATEPMKFMDIIAGCRSKGVSFSSEREVDRALQKLKKQSKVIYRKKSKTRAHGWVLT